MFHTPKIIRKIYPSLVWDLPTKEKVIYLTFDDGPIPEATPFVLDLLRKYNAKATFFCIGDNIRKNPEIFNQLIEDGHALGNHTFNHLNGWQTSKKNYLENTEACQKMLKIESSLFRPPYGKLKRSQINSLIDKQYKIIMWSVLSKDYDQKLDPEKSLKKVMKLTKEGSIVLFHDSIKGFKIMSFVLPKLLEHFSKEGYQFKKIEF